MGGRLGGRDPIPVGDRFWDRVAKSDEPDGCWEWQATRSASGYGHIWFNGRHHGTHRIAWMLTHGPIPDGSVVRHVVCDNPPCVRPDHLAIGTVADNYADMVAHNRQPKVRRLEGIRRGERHPSARLTAHDVRAIRIDASWGVRQSLLARQYGVTQQAIYRIVHRLCWKEVA